MFTVVFDEWATGSLKNMNLYPIELQPSIDAVNDWVYQDINDGLH